MPLKLSIALSRKAGEPNYGSRGATVGLELDVDASLVDQPQQLRRRIASLFQLARQSVEEELRTASATRPLREVRLATAAQIRALHTLASREELDLGVELESRFGIRRPADLSIAQASQVIDAIKSSANVNGRQ